MNMKLFKYIIASVAIVFASFWTSCSEDFLETSSTEETSAGTVAQTLDGLYNAVNGIHRNMVSQFLSNQGMGGEPGFIICREALGDDFTWDTQTWHQNFLQWSLNTNPSNSYNAGLWRTYYQFILNANLILEALDGNFVDSPEPLAKYVRGEALCIRAWAHFNLVQLYAKRYDAATPNTQDGIIYRENSGIEPLARISVAEVYTKINEDLDVAIPALAGYIPEDVNHYSQATAYGLKARVALAQQNYPVAAENAVKAITTAEAGGSKMLAPDQLMFGFADIATKTKDALYASITLDDQTVYFYSFYAYMGWNFNSSSNRTGIKCISSTTYDLMSETDLRRQWWDPTGKAEVPTGAVYNQRVYQHRKFTARSTANAVGEFAYMRLEEMYLTAAEAYARAGQNGPAQQYLTALLAQRDPGYTPSNTGAALVEEVMNNRRIELWGEGFRWFDLKRLGLPVNRTGTNFASAFCGFLTKAPNADGWVFEIPNAELNNNPLCTKNY
ncbi:membrane protein [Bacteroidia bacterium]|nr:membrane protein [Bacteroidia bacterium]